MYFIKLRSNKTYIVQGVKQNIVTIEPRTGNISATKLTGNTIVFNSYPDAGSRPPVTNTKAGTKVGFHVKVTGTVAAVLDSQTVANYHIAEPASTNKRKRETVVKHEDNNHEDVVDLTQLDSLYSEVAKQKERCARLLQADVRFV